MPEKAGNWLSKPLTWRLTIATTLLVSLCIHASLLFSFTFPPAKNQVTATSSSVINITLTSGQNTVPESAQPVSHPLNKKPVKPLVKNLTPKPEPTPALTPAKKEQPLKANIKTKTNTKTKNKTTNKKSHRQENRPPLQPKKSAISPIRRKDKKKAQHSPRVARSTAADPRVSAPAVKTVSQQANAEEIRLTYLHQLRQKISANKRYPLLARNRRLEGKVLIHFEVNGRGRIQTLNLISGPRLLQHSAEDAVKNALPFPPPKGISLPVKIELTLSYHLRLQS